MAVERYLTAYYSEALATGERLLLLLQSPITEERLGEVESMVDARNSLITAASILVNDRAPSDGALPVLRQLLEQQRILEVRLGHCATGLREGSASSQAVRSQMEGVRRLLGGTARSSMIDERR